MMLNWGFFPVLLLTSPLVAGLIVGFLIQPVRTSVLVNLASAAMAYLVLFVIAGFANDPVSLISASFLMAALGGLGSLSGALLHQKLASSKYQH